MTPDDVEDRWDFYFCRVDDAAASIFLNLWFEARAPVPSADHMYWVRIEMRDVGTRGVGTETEAKTLWSIDDEIAAGAKGLGLLYVGRLRNHGIWQMAFYGPSGLIEAFTRLCQAPGALAGRSVEIGAQRDADWSYYRDFLLPDFERRQWMQDRKTVEVLAEHGDRPAVPRRVDHWIYFATADGRTRFLTDAAQQAFASEDTPPTDPTDERPFGAQVYRTDITDLKHIHSVVMTLAKLAKTHGGNYDGWETSVEKAEG